jgi:putative peptidoglycan lipid II flippase
MMPRLLALLRPGTLAGNAVFTAVAYAVSRVLGLVREMLVAARFGTGETFDAYVAAFRIPDLIFVIVMSGAFGSAFIPVFSGFLARDDEEGALRLVNTLLTYTLIALSIVGLLMLVFAGPLVTTIVAPELSAEGQAIAIDLTRLFLLSPLLLGLGAAAKGMLEGRGVFTLPALAPIVYNLGLIFGVVALAPFWGIYGLAVGVIIGAFGNAAVQLGWLLWRGFRFRPRLSPKTEGLSKVGRMLSGRIGTQLVGQANLIVNTNIASRIGEGAISSIYFAQHLVMLPHGIIAMSLSTVIFPTLSRHHEVGNAIEFRRMLLRALGSLVFLSIPALVVLLVLRESVVQVIFQYGTFGEESKTLVAAVLGAYAVSLVFRAMIEPLTRAFYAMGDTRTPLFVLAATTVTHVLLGWALAIEYGAVGLASSLSVSTILRMLLLLGALSWRVDGLARSLARRMSPMLVPALAATALALVMAGPLAGVTDPVGGNRPLGYLLFPVALASVGVAYLGVAWAMRVEEARDLLRRIRR